MKLLGKLQSCVWPENQIAPARIARHADKYRTGERIPFQFRVLRASPMFSGATNTHRKVRQTERGWNFKISAAKSSAAPPEAVFFCCPVLFAPVMEARPAQSSHSMIHRS